MAVVALLVIPGRAGASTSFTFFGSGFGDGVGLSQYGAYGLAAKGWSVTQILTHFFTGTTVGPAPSIPAKIRVGLLQDRQGVGITAQNQPTSLRLGTTTGTEIAQIPVGVRYIVTVKSGKYWVKKPDGTFVGGKGYGDSTQSLFAIYSNTGGSVYLDQTGHTYARGWIELNIYVPCTGCAQRLRAIQALGVQGYLYGVAEVPTDWSAVAQQVQAIASRSYALFEVAHAGQHRGGCNCAVYSTTRDQYYVGSDRELSSSGAAWLSAVNTTNGQVVLYNGATAQAEFYSASGGYTENVENVWGGSAVPYLRGVCDPGDYTTANPSRVWSVAMTGLDVEAKVKAYTGTDIGEAQGFSNITRGVSGRIISVKVNGTNASVTLSGWGFRSALGLRDDRVWINKNMNVQGVIRGTYDKLNCAPGLQKTPQNAEPGGAFQRFANGRIYLNGTQNKAYWLYGLVLTRYVNLGQWGSSLGWPTSGIQQIDPDHQKATFDNGTITCTISTSTCT